MDFYFFTYNDPSLTINLYKLLAWFSTWCQNGCSISSTYLQTRQRPWRKRDVFLTVCFRRKKLAPKTSFYPDDLYCGCCLVVKLRLTLCDSMDCSLPGSSVHGISQPRILDLYPWDFPAKNTGVGCHFLLQGIFLTQRLNPQLLHWQADSLPLHHQGSPDDLC